MPVPDRTPSPTATPPRTRVAAWIGAVALLILHFDFYRPSEARLLFGWVPEELAYRVGWMVLATLYLLWFTRAVWRRLPEARRE